MTKILIAFMITLFTFSAQAESLPITYSMGFPLKGNWWQITGFKFGGYNSNFYSYHLAVDTQVSKTPVGTKLYAPCSGRAVISDNHSFSGFGSDSAANPHYKGYAVVLECKLESGQLFTALIGHVQSGSENYDKNKHLGLVPVNSLVQKGQYIGRVASYWHGSGYGTNWHHVHFGIRLGAFDSSSLGSYILGYSSSGWSNGHSKHVSWVDPTEFVLTHSRQVTWHPNGTLVQVYGKPEIYKVINGQLWHIVSGEVFNAHNFSWEQVTFISQDEFDCFEISETKIDWQPYRELYNYGESYFLLEKNCDTCETCTLYRFIMKLAFDSWGYSQSTSIDYDELEELKSECLSGDTLYLRNGTVIKSDHEMFGHAAGTVFVSQDNGVLSPFLTEKSFWALGYNQTDIMSDVYDQLELSYSAFGDGIDENDLIPCEIDIAPGGVLCEGQECENEPPVLLDLDGDGFKSNIDDCDDADKNIHPGAVEACNYIDEDCDGLTDEGLFIPCETECGIGSAVCMFGDWEFCEVAIFNKEVCDGVDNNCNDEVDEGCDVVEMIEDVGSYSDVDYSDTNVLADIGPDLVPDVEASIDVEFEVEKEDVIEPEVKNQDWDNVVCSFICPWPMQAHVWYGSDGYENAFGVAVVQTTKEEVCLRGGPWMDFNCALPDWVSFDPMKAEVECNYEFVASLGQVDFDGEGEVWFTEFSCY